ncbi:MAG: class I SAM-dependent methyltransferase [Actinobacteria bacterium]|uniref:Unannotated protein n=1 Tax=freshwater metagenome TaxID=449393 RepID=A0A6J5YQH0_9ZZZZ|nr:class I SAM-dependent methyltransferase [Actinomycetota bacterium]
MTKVLGDVTRGTTNPNRLRRVDRWMLHAVCGTIRAAHDPIVVDVGFGVSPSTTSELHQCLYKHVRADIEVVGFDNDPQRVADAQYLAVSGLQFKQGGFAVPLDRDRKPIAIRAFNVLRQYDADEVVPAWREMTARLAPQGFLIDGTCDEIGRRCTWLSIRAGAQEPETFTMSVHVGSLDVPSEIAARLPKVLIHENVPGQPLHSFLSAMDRAWQSPALVSSGPRQRWVATIESLAASGYPVIDTSVRWSLGELTVPWSVVRPTSFPG